MSIDADITGSAYKVLVFSVGDVLLGACVSVLLGKTKVNDEQLHTSKRERERERERVRYWLGVDLGS